ncbi:MAG: fimbria/pilus periplasmic chaperone [Mizugakiibacter sp.]|uniref:fimbrial biogenesis chaperone n=1 Tax=Mizugakiibacter sp. TaxID=1972610 RepID=UPI0031C9EE2F|nr:fimbria/pilus periplasmic chaperone [Xanthomonadaceae bacterium]
MLSRLVRIIGQTCAAAVLALGAGVGTATAANFSINPLRVELGSRHQAEMLLLHNDGTSPLRLQVETTRWTMDAAGAWQTVPTDELIATPLLLEIAVDGSAQLRVGTLAPVTETERAYRLLINELPGDDDAADGQVHLRVLTRVSLPVFIEPAGAKVAPRLAGARFEQGRLRLDLANTGSRRMDPQTAGVTLLDANGHKLFAKDVSAGYVLAGATLPVQLAAPAEACRQARTVRVHLGADDVTVEHTIADERSCVAGTSSS